MGVYLNPGNEEFASILRSPPYVDKSGLIAFMNERLGTPLSLVCHTRPRRFGKTYAAQMLVAYYTRGADSRPLFDSLVVAQTPGHRRHLNQADTIFWDIARFASCFPDKPEAILPSLCQWTNEELIAAFPDVSPDEDLPLAERLLRISTQTGRRFFIIIDEWDVLFREAKNNPRLINQYLHFLRSLFKGAGVRRSLLGAYLTGILPISSCGTESALTDFDEFTMTNPGALGEFIGFTEPEVRALCDEHGRDFNELRRLYEGYPIQGVGPVYNPLDVGRAGRQLAARKHVLSLMDNDQSANLEALVEAGVTSFKIEGRLKDAAYVKNITAYYRGKLDALITKRAADGWRAASLGKTTFTFEPDPRRTFHRGATDYFVNGRRPMIAQLATPKSTGEAVGRVVRLATNPAAVTVKTKAEIANGDGLVYLDRHEALAGLAVNRAEANGDGTVTLYLHESLARHPDLSVGTELNRNKDRLFAKTLAGDTARRAIPAALVVTARPGELALTARAASCEATAVLPFDVQNAKNAERAKESLENAMKKTGDTPFDAASVAMDASAMGEGFVPFVPMSAANGLRREALEKLAEVVRKAHHRGVRNPELPDARFPEDHFDFRGNVANAPAESFWKAHGVIRIEPAAEADRTPLATTDSLMHTRHCVRWTLGLCPRQTKGDEAAKERFKAMNGGHLKPEPLYLTDDKGRRLVARFDCKACEMHVGFAGDGFPTVR